MEKNKAFVLEINGGLIAVIADQPNSETLFEKNVATAIEESQCATKDSCTVTIKKLASYSVVKAVYEDNGEQITLDDITLSETVIY